MPSSLCSSDRYRRDQDSIDVVVIKNRSIVVVVIGHRALSLSDGRIDRCRQWETAAFVERACEQIDVVVIGNRRMLPSWSSQTDPRHLRDRESIDVAVIENGRMLS